MSYSFREGVTGVKELAREIRSTCDAYRRRDISSDDLKEYIQRYAYLYPDKLFNGEDYNPTVKTMIGQRRITLLDVSLDGYQRSLFSQRLT